MISLISDVMLTCGGSADNRSTLRPRVSPRATEREASSNRRLSSTTGSYWVVNDPSSCGGGGGQLPGDCGPALGA